MLLLIIIGITVVFSFFGFQKQDFFQKYMFQVGAIQQRKEYIRLLTAGFLHADMMHLLFNMMTLWFFGPLVIEYFGQIGFLIIYIGSLLLGNLFSLFIYRTKPFYSAIGASGAVSGILFAAIAMNPHIGIGFMFIPIPIPGYIFGALYFGYSVYMMLNPKQWDNLGHAAHLGGAAFGIIYTIAMQSQIAIQNANYLLIMALPLAYLSYEILVRKRIG